MTAPAKTPRIAQLVCPGQDFQCCDRQARLQLRAVEAEAQPAFARELRAFDEACARAYWLALLRD